MALRIIISLLLASSLLVALNIPQVVTQNVVTSYQYSTTSLTATVYSTFPITGESLQPAHYASTPADYDSSTGSFTLSFTIFKPGPVGQQGELDYACLYYDYFLLNATAGHTIRSYFELSMPERAINFLILNMQQFESLVRSECGQGLEGSMLSVFAHSMSVDWVVPETGEYALVFATPVFYDGQVYYSAQDYSTIMQSETATSTLTSILQNTYSALSTQSTLSALSSTSSMAISNAASNWPLVILILGVGVGIVLIALRKRR